MNGRFSILIFNIKISKLFPYNIAVHLNSSVKFKRATDAMLGLPSHLSAVILSDWLSLRDLSVYIVASCSKSSRKEWLDCLPYMVLTQSIHGTICGFRVSEWICQQCIAVEAINFWLSLVDNLICNNYLIKCGRSLKCLVMNHCISLHSVALHCPNLIELTNVNAQGQICSAPTVHTIESLCPRLTHIELVGQPVPCSSIGLPARNFHSLIHVRLELCGMVIKVLTAIVKTNPALNSIEIVGGGAFPIKALVKVLKKCAPTLRCLQLQKLSAPIDDAALVELGTVCAYLQKLGLWGFKRMYNGEGVDSGLGRLLKCCTNLRSFSSYMDDSLLRQMAAHLPKLEEINASHNGMVTHIGICALVSGCHSITSADLRTTTNIGDTGLIALLRNCPLEELRIEGMGGITSASAHALRARVDRGHLRRYLSADFSFLIEEEDLVSVLRKRGCRVLLKNY